MKTGAFSEKIKAIDFFHMYVKGHVGAKRDVVKPYKGAVIFGNELRHSCEVLRIIPPVPESKQLLSAIESAEKELGNEKIIFHNRSRADVISMLQTYCQQGSPLRNIFNEDVARIEGLTPFQLSVYREACQIPVGETRAYSWFNLRLRRSGLSRAVGGAMRSNPFPLLIPCHRVVRKNGDIGGFMGEDEGASWQLSLKKAILELESLYHQPDLFSKDVSSSVSNVIVLTPKARQVV